MSDQFLGVFFKKLYDSNDSYNILYTSMILNNIVLNKKARNK